MKLRLWLFTLLMPKTNFLFVPKPCMWHFGLTWWRPAAQCFVCKESLCSVRMQKCLRQGIRWNGLVVCCRDWICCRGDAIETHWGSGVHSSECFAGLGCCWPSPSHHALDFLTPKKKKSLQHGLAVGLVTKRYCILVWEFVPRCEIWSGTFTGLESDVLGALMCFILHCIAICCVSRLHHFFLRLVTSS